MRKIEKIAFLKGVSKGQEKGVVGNGGLGITYGRGREYKDDAGAQERLVLCFREGANESRLLISLSSGKPQV